MILRLYLEFIKYYCLHQLLKVLQYAELCVQAKLDGGRLRTGTIPAGNMIVLKGD
jgi:hypothetical protein